jgi:hypothetical protein
MAALSFLAGCACTGASPHLSADFGDSQRRAVASQTIETPGRGDAPVEGLDGQAAERLAQKYRQSFDRPDPKPVYTINLGR